MSEIDFYGLYIPVLLLHGIVAFILFKCTAPWIDRLSNAGWILYPQIFYLAWYLLCLWFIHWAYWHIWL